MGNKVQVESEVIQSNQVVNPMRELWRRESEMEMKSSFIQLCMKASTWNMVAIFGLERI